MRWMIGFLVACAGAVIVVLSILWALTGFASLGISGHGFAALILGSVLTTGVAVGLMALIFYSNRSQQDEVVHHAASKPERRRD